MPNNFSLKPSDLSGPGAPKPPAKTASLQKAAKKAMLDFEYTTSTNAKGPKRSFWSVLTAGAVGIKDIVFFTRQFSILLNASVPLTESLRVLIKQTSNTTLKKIIQQLVVDIDSGSSLSAALSKHPHVFNSMFVNLIRTGEVSGTLDKSLNYIADQQEKDYNLRRKVKSALSYPIFVLVAMVGVLGVLFTFVMPKMLLMLTETGAELPLTTKILVATTQFMSGYWWLLLILIAGGIAGFKYTVSNPEGRLAWDTIKLRIPVVGNMLKNVYVERFSRNFAILIQGGVPVVSALRVTSGTVSNRAYEKILNDIAQSIENGNTLAESMRRYPNQMPLLVTQMVDIGEKTSKIDEILIKVSTFYERETDVAVGTLTQLLEPFVMLVLGGVVAVIVSGVLLPIYNLVAAQ